MSSKETIDMMVEAGKATAGPAVGQKLGPLKINIAEVLKEINKKTSDFKGMKVPVKLIIDKDTKKFEIEVGLPPTTELIKSELKLEKGSGIPDKYKIGNISIEQVIKISKMKQQGMYTNNLKSAVKSAIGSCNSLGVLIESRTAPEIIKEINQGKYDKEINEQKTQPSEEKLKQLQKDLELKQEQGKQYLEKIEAEKAAKAEATAPAEEKKEGTKEESKSSAKLKASQQQHNAKEEKKTTKKKPGMGVGKKK